MSAKNSTRKSAATRAVRREPQAAFSEEERAAMRDRAREQKAAARASRRAEDGEREVLSAIGGMPGTDRAIAERIHALVKAHAPSLSPRTWYGMPAYERDGKVVCFFQGAGKFKTRYSSFGFTDAAHLDDGAMWPVAFALVKVTADEERRIGALLKQAVR